MAASEGTSGSGARALASVAFATVLAPRIGLTVALREAGFRVDHSAPEELAFVTSDAGWVTVVIDLDDGQAAAVLAQLRRLSGGDERRWWLAAVGRADQARALALPRDGAVRLFSRPLDAQELLDWLYTAELHEDESVEVDEDAEVVSGPATVRPSLARAIELAQSSAGVAASLPEAGDSDIQLADFSALAGLPGVDSIFPPDVDVGGEVERSDARRLSPEIEALLDASARRLASDGAPFSEQVANEQSIKVPAEVLATLDEMLLPDGARAGVGSSVDLAAAASQASAPPTEAIGPGLMSVSGVFGPPDGAATSVGRRAGTAVASSSPRAGTTVAVFPPFDSTRPAALTDAQSAAGGGLRQSAPPMSAAGHTHVASSLHHRPSTRPPSMPPAASPDSLALAHELLARRFEPYAAQGPSHERAAPGEQPAPSSGRGRASRPSAAASAGSVDPFPEVQGDPVEAFAGAVRNRVNGCLLVTSADDSRMRRVLLRDGDLVNAISDVHDEALLFFLAERGDVSREIAAMRAGKLPHSGRRAAAALIANGYLGQEDLWPVLRAHAEWVVVRTLRDSPARVVLDEDPPERVLAEPNVFGGAAGVEVFIEALRRMLLPADAAKLLQQGERFTAGPRASLLAESALVGDDVDVAERAVGMLVDEVLGQGAELAPLLLALVRLQILALSGEGRRARAEARAARRSSDPIDPLDVDAVRQRVEARVALVHEADYFQLLGLQSDATPYEIKRAYLELRRNFEPSRLITPATADLADDVALIVDVLDEAYDILRDANRCRRYRNALQATS